MTSIDFKSQLKVVVFMDLYSQIAFMQAMDVLLENPFYKLLNL